jgi:hypothetical protein
MSKRRDDGKSFRPRARQLLRFRQWAPRRLDATDVAMNDDAFAEPASEFKAVEATRRRPLRTVVIAHLHRTRMCGRKA